MQDFLRKRNMQRVYVITKGASIEEFNHKKRFVNENYGISMENVYLVEKETEKKEGGKQTKKKSRKK